MLRVLRKGGTFVLKVHELASPLMLSLAYILSRHFKQFLIFKSSLSVFGSSERFLICLHLTGDPVGEFEKILQPLLQDTNSNIDLAQNWLTNPQLILSDESFLVALNSSHNLIAGVQLQSLCLLAAALSPEKQTALVPPPNQTKHKRSCLDQWKINERILLNTSI